MKFSLFLPCLLLFATSAQPAFAAKDKCAAMMKQDDFGRIRFQSDWFGTPIWSLAATDTGWELMVMSTALGLRDAKILGGAQVELVDDAGVKMTLSTASDALPVARTTTPGSFMGTGVATTWDVRFNLTKEQVTQISGMRLINARFVSADIVGPAFGLLKDWGDDVQKGAACALAR